MVFCRPRRPSSLTEIDSFRHLSSCHWQQNRASAVLTGLQGYVLKSVQKPADPLQASAKPTVCSFSHQSESCTTGRRVCLCCLNHNNDKCSPKRSLATHSLTDLLILLQGHTGFSGIRCLNKNQLVPLDVLQDSLEPEGWALNQGTSMWYCSHRNAILFLAIWTSQQKHIKLCKQVWHQFWLTIGNYVAMEKPWIFYAKWKSITWDFWTDYSWNKSQTEWWIDQLMFDHALRHLWWQTMHNYVPNVNTKFIHIYFIDTFV